MEALFILVVNGGPPMIKPIGGDLYDLSEFHKASGYGPSKRPGSWTRSLSDFKCTNLCIKTLKGRYGRTTANKQGVLQYAAWIDKRFEDVVFKTFMKVMERDVEGAMKKASEVARGQVYFEGLGFGDPAIKEIFREIGENYANGLRIDESELYSNDEK